MPYEPRSLPPAASDLCEKLKAPPDLVAHLRLVHDAAAELVAGLKRHFPKVVFADDAVLFGAATHDLGKVRHPNELVRPGSRHESDGAQLLEENGVTPSLARFARTHGAWPRERLPLEDIVVALADCVWKGQRLEALEAQMIDRILEQVQVERWEVFDALDALLAEVAVHGDQRLAWQRTGP